jgi:H+-transporting ATPase
VTFSDKVQRAFIYLDRNLFTCCRYFPTILIVILAVMNDGAMIALSKDRVTPSPTPNCWRLRDVFIIGIVYGLYLTLSTWVLFHVGGEPGWMLSYISCINSLMSCAELS